MTYNSESFREEADRQAKELEKRDRKAGHQRSYWDRINEVIHAEIPINEWQKGLQSKLPGRARKYAVPLAPEPLPIVSEVLSAEGELGTDMNGSTLYTERRAWLDEQDITEPRKRALYLRLFRASVSERAREREKDREAEKTERPQSLPKVGGRR